MPSTRRADIDRGNGEIRAMPVHHRVYLLAYDLAEDDLYDRTRTAFLARAGVLTELARRGCLVEADGDVQVVEGGSTGDPVLDEALHHMAGHKRSWSSWLRRDYKRTLAAIEHQLQTTNVLSVHKKRVFGLVPRTRVTVTDTALVSEIQEQARTILRGSQPAGEIDPVDAALVALAAAGLVPAVVSRRESREHRDRIEALTGRVGAIAPGLQAALQGLRTTMIAAQGGIGGS